MRPTFGSRQDHEGVWYFGWHWLYLRRETRNYRTQGLWLGSYIGEDNRNGYPKEIRLA